MLSVAEALALVIEYARPLRRKIRRLARRHLGSSWPKTIVSDIDMPPFDKALMDGYAFRFEDLHPARLRVGGRWGAHGGSDARSASRASGGDPHHDRRSSALRRRHGRHDRTHATARRRASPDPGRLDPGRRECAAFWPRDAARGSGPFPGSVLRPQELGLLATVGRTSVKAYPGPRVAIICTGDELVEAPERPGPGKIRNGNGPMIAAMASRAGAGPRYLGIVKDDMASLRESIRQGLESPVMILSGGVSAGKRDLVPAALEEANVRPHLHKVAMKPGKPVFFGTRDGTLVFGLPGNPVSALVCFELFVRPALSVLGGHHDSPSRVVQAIVEEDFTYRTDRQTYYPAVLSSHSTGWRVRMVPWFGSADLRSITNCNSFAILPAGITRSKRARRSRS